MVRHWTGRLVQTRMSIPGRDPRPCWDPGYVGTYLRRCDGLLRCADLDFFSGVTRRVPLPFAET